MIATSAAVLRTAASSAIVKSESWLAAAELTAEMVTVFGDGRLEGAVYRPVEEIVPVAAAPPLSEPALSPNHLEIAFVSGGDIWTVPSGGGEAHLLVSNPATESRPLYTLSARTGQPTLAR